jgi:pentatricopeptide repeat protein
MVAAKLKTKIRSYSYVLQAYSRLHKADRAFAIYERMKADGLEATDTEFASLIRVLAATGEGEGSSARAAGLLDDMNKALLELSSETIEALSTWYSRQGALVSRPAHVGDNGLCTSCGDVLASVDLGDAAVASLMEKLDAIVREDPGRVARWEDFCSKLPYLKFDVIIDGANIGFYKPQLETGVQHVNYEQIDMVVDHLLEQGYQPLLVLQYRHLKYDWVPEQFHPLIKKWKSSEVLFVCPLKSNDDWYWMYAALQRGKKVAVVTNDEMRDHTFQMLAHRDFMR